LKRFVLFGVIALVGVALDQWTKLWASETLAHACPVVSTKGDDMAPAIARCREDGVRIHLREPAAQLLLMTSDSGSWRLRCDEGKPCLRGHITLGKPRAGAESVGGLGKLLPGVSYWLRSVHEKKYGSIRFNYERITPPLVLIPGYLSLEYAENRGAAWSFLADKPGLREPLLIGVASLAIGLLGFWVFRMKPEQKMLAVALALLFAGAVGNLIDRIRLGYVIDFIVFTVKESFRWPTFNVADTSIALGIALLIIDSIRGYFRDRRARSADKSGGTTHSTRKQA